MITQIFECVNFFYTIIKIINVLKFNKIHQNLQIFQL